MFKDKLKELREANEMKQEELARKMYISRPVISKWERGLQYPNVEQLKQLSQIFHISMDELMDNMDYMKMPEVQPIMETKEETNLELLFFTVLLSLFVVKLMFDLTVEYNPKTFDWLMENVVFIPVLAYATYKSYRKEVNPKLIGFISIYLMMSYFIKRVYLNVQADMLIGFKWINFYYGVLLNYSFPLIYSAVILLFYREEKEEKKKDRQNALLYWILMIMTAVYEAYYLFWYFIGFSSSMFGWNEHFIYSTVSTLTRCFITAFMIFEATKLRKKRIQARMSVSK